MLFQTNTFIGDPVADLDDRQDGHYEHKGEVEVLSLTSEGYIPAWLVAGPQEIPVQNLERFDAEQPRPQILQNYHQPELPITAEPIEGGLLEINDLHGKATFPWRRENCGDDRLLDHTTFGFTCHYLRTWAFAKIQTSTPRRNCCFVLTANGPSDVWVNGAHVYSRSSFDFQVPGSETFHADLKSGDNHILVAFSVVAIRECPYTFALQVKEQKDRQYCRVALRTLYLLGSRQSITTILNAAYLDHSAFCGSDELIVSWPSGIKQSADVTIRLQAGTLQSFRRASAGRPAAAEAMINPKAGASVNLGTAESFPNGDYVLVLSSHSEDAGHSVREIPITIANGEFSTQPYGTYGERVKEGLLHAAASANFYGEFARMALGRWDDLRPTLWEEPFRRIQNRGDCSDFYLVGMLGALSRYKHDPGFPSDLKDRIARAALSFRYWRDEPGCDAMCFHTENHQILFHACEVLAGQLFPDVNFSNSGETGEWHQKKGERLAAAWLKKRAEGGFQEWDSNVYFEIDIAALTHLADLSTNPDLASLASMVLDKLLLTIALNSFRGVFGSTHGRVYSHHIKGARRELTSGVCRMLWGMGAFNDNFLGIVSLASAVKYRLPAAIREIAENKTDAMWNRERHAGEYDPSTDAMHGEWEVNKVSYKTRDFMICSAQDLMPGRRGNQQHIWQATFGPDAVVFTTHPVCTSEDSSRRPNFWSGNGVLPRVAQWKDFLIVLYNLPENDWMGFTHAYFPVYQFCEWTMRNGWMFARKDAGYIALHGSNGLELMRTTTGALEDLRSPGLQSAWLCQMGSEEKDGSFAAFQEQVLNAGRNIQGLSVSFKTIRGDDISFSWSGPLCVNGMEEHITGFKHYENPHCTAEIGDDQLVVHSAHHTLHLDFKSGHRTESGRK